MKVVCDKDVPFLKGVLEPYGEVVYKKGTEITSDDVRDADALILRTRTRCNAELLEGSSVKLIATATIGTDHVDFEYCNSHGIVVHNAAGCNAGGVMQYVFSALYGVAARKGIKIDGGTLGIVGVGNVGKKVEKMAEYLGFNVLRCDPPRAEAEGPDGFCSLEHLLANSQIVTMHVPLDDTTRRMADEKFFAMMPTGSIFINASRGEVVDEEALIQDMPKFGAVVIDTWNGEPDINEELMDMVDIATPHIAGYSAEGKMNATNIVLREFMGHIGYEGEAPLLQLAPPPHPHVKAAAESEALLSIYSPLEDTATLKSAPGDFESLRNNYKLRREPSAFAIEILKNVD